MEQGVKLFTPTIKTTFIIPISPDHTAFSCAEFCRRIFTPIATFYTFINFSFRFLSINIYLTLYTIIRRFESLILRHSLFETLIIKTTTDVISLYMIRSSIDNTINFKSFNGRRIADLCFLSCPSAIIRHIVSIVINTVKRIGFIWAFTHIYKKISKSIWSKPSITNFNSSATISKIVSIFFVVTSLFHSSIRVIFKFIYTVLTISVVSFLYPILNHMNNCIDVCLKAQGEKYERASY